MGALEVTSTAFEDSTPYFVEGEDPFVVRFRVYPEVMLSPEHGIPIQEVWTRVEMCSEVDPQQVGWAYKTWSRSKLGADIASRCGCSFGGTGQAEKR
jgi:hypothetical protein